MDFLGEMRSQSLDRAGFLRHLHACTLRTCFAKNNPKLGLTSLLTGLADNAWEFQLYVVSKCGKLSLAQTVKFELGRRHPDVGFENSGLGMLLLRS